MLTLLLLSCNRTGDDSGTITARGDCNPVEDAHCLLPFPSDFFLTQDDTTATGLRMAFGADSLPVNIDGVPLDPVYLHEKDGFSPNGSMLAHLPGAMVEGLLTWKDPSGYLDADVKTVLLDAETGERIPHFVEREAAADSERSLLMLRPLQSLGFSRQIIVGIRGLVDDSGAPVAAPTGFTALRDGTGGEADLERQRDHYSDTIFPVLESAGFAREELQLAWSLTTSSETSITGRLDWMLADAAEAVGAGGPDYTITETTDSDCSTGTTIGRHIEGEMVVPLYLTDWQPGSLLTRDDAGMPYRNGTAEVPFTIRVPCSLLLEPRPGALLQYGHGLLGGRSEVESSFLGQLADDNGMVVFAADWTGMKFADTGPITLALIQDPHMFSTVPERTMQGFVEFTMLATLMSGDMVGEAQLTVEGTPLIDPERLYFYGNSQGAVLGGAYAAMSPDIQRAVLGVPGMPFSLLLTRAEGFAPFFQLLETMYEDWADITLMINLFQPLWDPGESGGWVHRMDRPVLMQAAIGDASVPTIGAHVLAHNLGAGLASPSPRAVWGLDAVTLPTKQSVLVEFDYGIEEPLESVPATDADSNPHNSPRYAAAGIAQIAGFLSTGVIEQTCDEACDPD
ncbi:MAG: hypothetical protein ACI8RZ_002844 [Myxococcota bacterium]|jgi:hypothetical protein